MVRPPDDTRVSEPWPALVDSGAAITVIPAEVAEQLALLKYSEVALADWMDITVTASAYLGSGCKGLAQPSPLQTGSPASVQRDARALSTVRSGDGARDALGSKLFWQTNCVSNE